MATNIQNIISRIEADKETLGIKIKKGASERDISKFESKGRFKLPEDIKEFYKFCNGFDSDEDLFRIIPLSETLQNLKDNKVNQFHIAEYMIYSDMWTVEIDSENQNIYGIYNSDHESEWVHLTNSFAEYLKCFLDNGVFGPNGLYEWRNKLKMK